MHLQPYIASRAYARLITVQDEVAQLQASLPGLEPEGYHAFAAGCERLSNDAAVGAWLVSAALREPLRPIDKIPRDPADMRAGEQLSVASFIMGGASVMPLVALDRGELIDKDLFASMFSAARSAALRGMTELTH